MAVVAVVAVIYFTSDVHRTRIDAALDQYAHWTPENIAKDPENYLNFCEKQANDALFKFKASEISIAQARGTLMSMLEEAKSKIAIGDKTLGELKAAYTQADAAANWPATWDGQARDQDWFKRNIMNLHKEVESKKALRDKVESGIKKLDAQVIRVQDGRAKTQQQLAEIKTGREMLKVQKLTDELTTRLTSIKSVLQATVAIASEPPDMLTLDGLAASKATVVDDADFQKVMGQ